MVMNLGSRSLGRITVLPTFHLPNGFALAAHRFYRTLIFRAPGGVSDCTLCWACHWGNRTIPIYFHREIPWKWVGEKGFDPHKQVKGRKRHLMTDTLGLVLFVVVCAACIADSDGASSIFHETEGRFPRLHTVLVDQGYKGWLVEFAKRWFDIVVDIVSRSPSQREFIVQPQRWKIKRTFGWLGWSRILSKEYERTTESSESNIYLASIRLILRSLVSSPT